MPKYANIFWITMAAVPTNLIVSKIISMCYLEGIIPCEEQSEQESYSYQGIKTALVTLVGNLKL